MKNNFLRPAVILVADRTLSANYPVLFEGIFATMQTSKVPEPLMRYFLSPKVHTDENGRASVAPLGLRRIESCMRAASGLSPDDIVCTTPERLFDLIGPWVKLVLFSSSDPLGHGMSNTTTSSFWGGELYTRRWTRETLLMLKAAKKKYPFKVVFGGAGAWQFITSPDEAARLGIDVVYEGYFEESGPELIADILAGRHVDNYVAVNGIGIERVQPICGPSMMGIIELSRGCGRGCRFCSMAQKGMKHLSPDMIMADLETNLSNGIKNVVSGSEDFFRYGSSTTRPDFKRLASLLEQMRGLKGLSFMQIDHANITSVIDLEEKELVEIRRLLTWEKPAKYLWVNMGAESANGRLVAANSPGKIAPFSSEDWPDIIREAVGRMTRSGFFPVISIVLGLPGEEPKDVIDTLSLIKELSSQELVVFPVFYEPVLEKDIRAGGGFSVSSMSMSHFELYRTCYEINFKRVPKLMWDNQQAGGVPWLKRMIMQVMGRAEIFNWRMTFRGMSKRLSGSATISAYSATEKKR
ncbi:MAG: B12-binding domain-containing radical SAM protein [Desulfatiglans sp.]|nr:B12-binding domain-containing radical SAM protein [Desulfatiglans sp.]